LSLGAYAATVLLVGLVALIYAWSADRLALRLAPALTGTSRWLAGGLVWAALIIWSALLTGTVGLLSAWSMALSSGLTGLAVLALDRFRPLRLPDRLPEVAAGRSEAGQRINSLLLVPALLTTGLAFGAFLGGVGDRVRTGLTGFDSTWYHGPIAAEIARTGDTLSPHFVAPQFLTWFYPHNSELLHAIGLIGFGSDFPSLFINLALFIGCLAAGWGIGRVTGAGPLSMAGVALVIGAAVFADQAGEARNDLAGTFFLLAGVALAVHSADRPVDRLPGLVLIVALAGGLAAGTKLNFLPAGLVLAIGSVYLVPGRARRAVLPWALLGVVLGGAYWYLRNLVASGNPLPWMTEVGPLSLPGPDQATGGREPGSVASYLGDLDVISDYLVPGFSSAFGDGWPVLLVLALIGTVLGLRRGTPAAWKIGALATLAVTVSWAFGPTSAPGPAGEPVGFPSGLRYLAPGLAIGMALLGMTVGRQGGLPRFGLAALLLLLAPFAVFAADSPTLGQLSLAIGSAVLMTLGGLALTLTPTRVTRAMTVPLAALMVFVLLGFGYLARDSFEKNRYASPRFVTAGLADAYRWARESRRGTRIGTTASRIYPLTNPGLDNEVFFVGLRQPRAGFTRATRCRDFVSAVNADRPDYLVASLDREGFRTDFPPEVSWLDSDPAAEPVFRTPPTALFRLTGPLDPDRCRQ